MAWVPVIMATACHAVPARIAGSERCGSAALMRASDGCGMMTPVTSSRDFERAGWESHVDPYHQFFGPICARLADHLLDAVGAGRASRLLDACCGPGYVAGRALERGVVVEG